jgi:hypothetical protein
LALAMPMNASGPVCSAIMPTLIVELSIVRLRSA